MLKVRINELRNSAMVPAQPQPPMMMQFTNELQPPTEQMAQMGLG